MRKIVIIVVLLGLAASALLVALSPSLQDRLLWGYIQADAYLRGVFDPAGAIPTPLPTATSVGESSATPTATLATLTPTIDSPPTTTPTPQPSPTPLPENVVLDPPEYELQDINGCGPATLAMYLRYYGWEGDQETIDAIIKPDRRDRNVNVEELAYYTWNYAGWLNLIYRVDGDIDLLKALIANGIPVMIEEGDEL
ncbi:MAG: C39 family peptidase, partial [Anaerolineales bacterium]